jgi:DNA-binding MarR family transcriptional regulator
VGRPKDHGNRPRSVGKRSAAETRLHDAAEVVNHLRRLFKAIHEYSKAILKRTGLSGPQVWALTVLGKRSGLSLGELSERLFAHPATVSGIVDRLEERGAVRRTVDPQDRRGVRLSLTPLGRRLLRSSPPPVQIGLRRALETLPASRLRHLRRSLDRVVQDTVASRVEAPFFDLESPGAVRGRRRLRKRT